ncbi:MAG: hypothetical protein PHV60_00820 [bacterium]|nr:hypothetical protein [bacterium]
MNELKSFILGMASVAVICFSTQPLFALREVEPAAGQSISQAISQEKVLQKQIVTEKKMLQQPRVTKPLPKSLPMPTKEEMQTKAILAGSQIPAAAPVDGDLKKIQQDIPGSKAATESRAKALKGAAGGNNPIYGIAGVILVLLLIIGMIILFKQAYGKKEEGNALVFSVVVILVIFIIGASVVFLSENETRKTVQSSKQNAALYIADGGIEKAMWELNRSTGYEGESNIPLGSGTFTVVISTPAGNPNQREIVSTGQIGLSRRKIKTLCEKIPGTITVNSALACGGNVNMGGNASVAGGTLTGILVPVGCSVSTAGGSIVTGTPSTGNAPFPSFEDVFGMTMAQMEGFATNKYTNPGNNPVCSGITWVDGDLKATTSSWSGTGVLIVNGDFDMSGGNFTGVIYVVGTFRMTGNARIDGSILSQSMAEVTGIFGTADIAFNPTAVEQANNVYPFKILTWQEMKN